MNHLPSPAGRSSARARLPHALARAFPLAFAGLAAGALPGLAPAQSASATAAPVPATVVITGNPLGSSRIAAPVSVLGGEDLVLRRGGTLGETLDGLPGVSSTSFGPNASRPVIRGLDGDRVRVLSNAGASLDASTLSYDHALPIDPLIVTRIEVLRGPGALFYGGSAVGGVVNALDNRIPREPLTDTGGSAELRLGGAARERSGAAIVETGDGRYALHADVFARDSADLRVPRYTPVDGGDRLDATGTVRNSAGRAQGGSIGGSLFFGPGRRIGLSADTYESRYGVVAEPEVHIEMKREHLGLAGEFKDPARGWTVLRLNANLTDYEHKEVDGTGAVGTVFASRGHDLRLEAGHAPLGALRGVIGLQSENFDFSALGDEAFVPSTRTRKTGLFALEQQPWSAGETSFGLRLERAQVDSMGDADALAPKFGGAAQRRFSLRSASLAHVLPLDAQWSLSASLSRTERAPTYFELYADGVHAATGAYERGDAALAAERGRNLDLALQWKHGADQLRVGLFDTRFSRFISLEAAGVEVDEAGQALPSGTADGVPLFEFRAVRARLRGVEIEAGKRLLERPWALDATARLDATRATNLDTGEPLPRIAPWRLNLGLQAAQGPWGARIDIDHAAHQGRVPSTDEPIAGYTLLNLSLSRRFDWGSGDALWFAKFANVGDRLAYSASAIQTIRGLSPLPGRAFSTGVRMNF